MLCDYVIFFAYVITSHHANLSKMHKHWGSFLTHCNAGVRTVIVTNIVATELTALTCCLVSEHCCGTITYVYVQVMLLASWVLTIGIINLVGHGFCSDCASCTWESSLAPDFLHKGV